MTLFMLHFNCELLLLSVPGALHAQQCHLMTRTCGMPISIQASYKRRIGLRVSGTTTGCKHSWCMQTVHMPECEQFSRDLLQL